MRRNVIHCVLVMLCIAATAEAVIILPMGKPKPPPDPSTLVINLGEIRLGAQEELDFACPQNPAWACIGSVELKGRLPNWCSAGASVWLDCLDPLGQTVTAGQQRVVPRDFVYQQQVPSGIAGVSLCIQNLADKQVVITNASLALTYAPDPATVALLAVGAAMLLVRRRF
jgi:hypothetical protein